MLPLLMLLLLLLAQLLRGSAILSKDVRRGCTSWVPSGLWRGQMVYATAIWSPGG